MMNDQINRKPSLAHKISLTLIVVVWIAFFVLLAVLNLDDRMGQAKRFAVSAGGATLAVMVTYLWFFFTMKRRSTRFVVLVMPALVAGLLATLQIDGFSGGLIPRFRFRWQESHVSSIEKIDIERTPAGIDLQTTSDADFPQFLGPHRDGTLSHLQLNPDWQARPPVEKWRVSIGAGWSGFVAVNGYAVTMEQRGPDELITCYEIATGDLQWAHTSETRHETVLGGVGPRSTPTIHDGKVFALGATGEMHCLDGATGNKIWKHDLVELMGGTTESDEQGIAFGRSGSPLIVDKNVVVPVGGPRDGKKATLIAFDQLSGEEVWRAGGYQVSYASPALHTLCGVRQIVMVVEDFVCSFDATDGSRLWDHPWPGRSTTNANVSQAMAVGGNRVFLSKGYSHGSELIEVSRSDTQDWKTDIVWSKHNVMKTKFSNILLHGDHAYGLDDIHLECIEIATGKKMWKKGRFGYGQILRVGEHLIVQAESGEVALVKATPDKFVQQGEIAALNGISWNNPCLFGRFLIVRNGQEAVCYELELVQ